MSTTEKPAGSALSRWLRKKPATEAVPKGYVSSSEFEAEDVFIVGYPKSGNTWFQDLAAGVVFGMLPEFVAPFLVQDAIPDMHARPWYRRYATPMFFKSHALPEPAYKRVVYLLRDGRDAMVSYYHHLVALEGEKIDFLETVREGRMLYPCKWHEHVTAWQRNPYGAEMITIKYEELKHDTAGELARFCKFAGLDRRPEFLKMIADGTAFEKMRKKERAQGVGDDSWPRDKSFRRRGSVGSYKDEMPPEVLAAFMTESGEVMRQNGYA